MAALMFSKKVLQILKKHSNNNDKNINDWNTEDTIIRRRKTNLREKCPRYVNNFTQLKGYYR